MLSIRYVPRYLMLFVAIVDAFFFQFHIVLVTVYGNSSFYILA